MTSSDTPYPHLLSPIDVGALTLPNRVIMGSMHTLIERLDRVREREVAFYVARARGGVGLIITGGVAPNELGAMDEHTPVLTNEDQADRFRAITEAVHAEGGRICMQVLHAGRYANLPETVSPSALATRIKKVEPRALAIDEVEQTIDDFARCAALARHAGFDGVEIMGSEGYLITQFCASRTNQRDDEWGGAFENRIRFPVEIIRRMRERVGSDFLIIYRLSALDLVEDGFTGEETLVLARAIEAAGADVLSTGIGWHEARVPTIAHMVPRAAWTRFVAPIRSAVSIPVVGSNRINTPEVAESVIAAGDADLVALARPFLADPDFVAKARAGRADEINTCIACNQLCLDAIFRYQPAGCLVNPRACREIEFNDGPAATPRRVAVVGAGPAGLACAVTAAERGHAVTLYEAEDRIGGQFNLARRIPGKEEFAETLRYYARRIEVLGVTLNLSTRATADDLAAGGYDEIVVATGVHPRPLDIPGADRPNVVSYAEALTGAKPVGARVAIVGAGGIGFDVAEFLTGRGGLDADAFRHEWGVDDAHESAGGLAPGEIAKPGHAVTLLQRKPTRLGRGLGLTTGWVLRTALPARGVDMIAGATYRAIDDAGLHVTVDGEDSVIEADTVVVCAGQEPASELHAALAALGIDARLIGGGEEAAELDAARAIAQGTDVAMAL